MFDLKSLPVSKITEYRSIVGKLSFAVNIGRPDISCAVSILSSFLKDPRHVHLQAATWDFQYLFTTKNYCLQYTIGSPLIIPTFSDAVSTPLVDFPYSTGWYVTQIAVFYKSIICLIVIESEYISVSAALRKKEWLVSRFNIMKVTYCKVNPLVDNQFAIQLSKYLVFFFLSSHTKYILLHYHKIKDFWRKGFNQFLSPDNS